MGNMVYVKNAGVKFGSKELLLLSIEFLKRVS